MSKRLAKLYRPCDKLDKYDNEPYMKNPLLHIRLSEIRQRRHYSYLQKKAVEEKVKSCKKPMSVDTDDDDLIPRPQEYYIRKLRMYASKAPIPKMLKRTENKIINFTPKRLRTKYPVTVNTFMKDVHEDFDRIMKAYSLQKILRPGPDDFVPPRVDFRFQRSGRTSNYQNYLKNRDKIRRILVIPHPFIRCIVNYSATDFPTYLVELDKYRTPGGEISIYDLKDHMKRDLRSNSAFLQKIWYPKIVKIIHKHYRKRTIPLKMWERALNCASGLINRQLNEMKIRTIDHLNHVILDRERMPFIKTIACMEGGLILAPSINEIILIFQEFIDDILAVGDHMDPITYSFEETARATMRGVLWKITIGDIYRQDALQRVKMSLIKAYECTTNYLASFQSDFFKLYSPVTETKLDIFLQEPHAFEERLGKIEEFKIYLDKIKRLVSREFFDIAIVNQSEAIKSLENIAQGLVDKIVDKLVEGHRQENLAICKEFETIKNKALAIPKSTEQLTENGEYMMYVKNTYIDILGERIQKSLQVMGILVELRELPQDLLDLQVRTVNWMHNIESAFETNSQNYEQYKFQFEEKLQEVIRSLSDKIDELIPHLVVINDMCEVEKLSDYHTILENFLEQIVVLDDYVTWTNKEELLFKFPKSMYPTLESIKTFVVPFMLLIKLCMRWLRHYYVWMDGPFEYLEPEIVSSTTDEFNREFQKTQKYYRAQIKADQLKDSVCKFKGQMEDPDPDKHPVPLKLCTRMTSWIKEFRMGVYVVNIMCNPALRDRHWDEMSDIAGFDVAPNAGTTLRKILNFKIEHILDKFEIISISANKELQLQQNLAAMIHEWETVQFTFSTYKDTNINILTSLDDIQCILDDHIVKTLAMRGSAFVKPCEDEVKAWYAKLTRINKTLEQWGRVQATWLYLLPIFSSADIVAQMPEEGELFVKVDAIYKQYMEFVVHQPLVVETAATLGLLEAMQDANAMLEDITNGVNAYLEKKRLYFPRFFFLSNDEMLEILSETKDPLRVQPHLSKCFEGINRLHFDLNLVIHSMMSVENEEVKFLNKISTEAARGSVEKWLLRVQEEMLLAIRHQINQSYSAYFKKSRSEWVLDWPGMIILCVSQIFWAAEMHSCFLFKNPKLILNFFDQVNEDLNEIVTLIRSKDITNLQRITIKALIVIDVHAKDVVEELIQMKVNSEQDFRWLSQLRYYFEGGNVVVKIINAAVKFACEYLGNSDRLVITPLTDRCYRTLMGAYQLHLNGAPEGPAGTGKTETTKDLAKALAVQCKVFNCSDGLDYKAMGKFFKGLASCGAWACFDEFNRIELEVLSVVAQQILSIIQAVRAKSKKFLFEGTEIELNPACYVCITMNPGYAGRSELPDNLKVLFRTVAMMIPDYAMIGEISLYSFGFVNARSLSVKIVTTYRLCSEQLSSQNHYDYGMRAVKTVLQACGNLKKTYPDEDEEILLLRSLIDVNLPKFLSFDVPLFNGIISDLFPGVSLPKPDYGLLTDTFNKVCKELCLQPLESFLIKVIQTFEMMIVRHGFMMVGEPYAGKSSTLKVLARCMELLKDKGINDYFQKVYIGIVNPKAVTLGQLYGAFDPVSYEWTDGIASRIFRSFAVDTTPCRKWLIFDGPVDAVWIENMNTVLDDNKKLCLTSGEVISMNNNMSMIFEVMDLSQASPATVSRCGMIYMEPVTLGWEAFALTWCDRQDPAWMDGYKDYVMDLLRWIVPGCILFVKKNCKQLLYPGDTKLLMTTLSILEMLMADACEENPEDYQKYVSSWYQNALLMAAVWGIGGILDYESRIKFDDYYREVWKGTDDANPFPDKHGKVDALVPPEGIVFDYYYVFKQKGIWKYWPDFVRLQKPESGVSVQIPTIDTARYMYMLDLHIKHRQPMLLVGPTGTGKSFYIQNYLVKLDPEEFIPTFITFTTQITAEQTQELVITKLHKHKRGLYGPPKGKKCVLFIDDMNMPAKEVYGAQPPIELVRQYFDHKTWYDATDATPIHVFDILIIAACGLVGGSRQDVYARFLCHFNIFSINNFSDETMHRIFSAVLLDGYKRSGHSSDVITNCNQIVNATLETYKFACDNLRPTPAKSHYVFNLRDVARVVMGCCLLKKESVESKKIFSRIWFHEIMRVFFDRLVNDVDRKLVFTKLADCIKDVFKDRIEDLFENYLDDKGFIDREKLNNLFFGSYFHMDIDFEERKYEEILDIRAFRDLAYKNLEEYNATTRMKMNIVFFQYALMHLNRVCRIMTIPGGSALLVGVGGSGRQSLTRLAANICNQQFFQPDITKNYGMNEWRDDLKKLLRIAGGLGRDSVFLFTEAQIKLEGFLQDIDCLLNLGEVPNIFAIDEKQEVLELVRLAAQGGNRNLDISPLQVFQYFISRCKQKLHIVLCFSPIGSGFRTWTRLYPSLVNCCTIDWFEPWPEDSLEMVAERYMQNLNVPQDINKAVVRACKYFHVEAINMREEFLASTGRIIYITSASYLELIKSYTKLIKIKQDETMASKMRYIIGLDKLQEATEAVAVMQKELNELQPTLLIMAENSRKMTEQIEKESIDAAAATEQVKKDEVVANIQAAEAQVLKADCEADLAVAIPILEDAIEALNTLKPADITLVKSMKNPPSAVKLVMAAVVVMKGIPPDRINDAATGRKILDYWGPSKRILGDMAFLQTLKEYDKDNINADIMKRIRKEFIPHPDFKPEVVAKASSAAEGLCKWVIAMDKYDKIAKEVAPKKLKLEVAEREYADTMRILNEKRSLALALEARVRELNINLAEANVKKKKVEDEVEACRNKLIRAETLISGLAGEKIRWIAAAEHLQEAYDSLAGDILLSCGIIAYLAPLTSYYRNKTVQNWFNNCKKENIPCTPEYSLSYVLGSDITTQHWNICGLPRDNFSAENAIIMQNSQRYSLFIDPQGQANKWIKTMERNNQIRVLKFSQSDYMKKLEQCIEFGYAALIENVFEDIDVSLDTLLARNTFQIGGHESISLGDNVIPMSPKFRLYFTSNLRNPHYLPEIFNKLTIVNFALTIEALEDQLLGIVVAKERPDLQELRQNLIVESAKNKATLKNVEDNILKTLSESKGDILEDETAIKMLDDSKILSIEIKNKQADAKVTEEKIESFRLSYKPVASHSSVLYYCITDLPNIDPMYQFSLAWFINLYVYSIEHANKSKDLHKRLKFLMDAITCNLYNNICRSLFEKDKLLFSFILTSKVMLANNQIDQNEFQFLISGGEQREVTRPNPAPDWIIEKMWDDINRLEQLSVFTGFVENFVSNLASWKRYFDYSDPQCETIPSPWAESTNAFEKMIILHAIRPDKVAAAITLFVAKELGEHYVMPPQFDIAKSYEDSNCLSPLIFILSPGADPMSSLLLFAERMGFDETFQAISLGQGQGPIAQSMIEKAQRDGTWICLQNCHLATSWMPTLEYIWENMDMLNTEATFRLWLTSYPWDKFPTAILQNGIKMTNEPPTGLRQNLLRSYTSEPMSDEKFYTGCPGKDRAFTKLLYGICFFHAIVLERRKFGSLGWNIPYGFNESDFQISVQQLQIFLNIYEEVPYMAISYLTGECNYGGRVTDAWDRRLICTILDDYVNEKIVNDFSYKFSSDVSFGIPRKTEWREVVKFIEENVPILPSPKIYGLHPNAGIMRDLNTSNLLLESMMLTQGKQSAGIDADAEKNLLITVMEIEKRLPELTDLEAVKEKYPVDYNESMNTVLVQEMERFNRLLFELKTTCVDVQKAIKGLLVMTPELEDTCNSIIFKKIPTRWMKKSYPSLKPVASYIQDFLERLRFLQEWSDIGKPAAFWISGFYFTQAFLTGAMQNYARQYRIPIDTLTFDFVVKRETNSKKSADIGVYVYGLFVDGARWLVERGCLDEQLPKVLLDVMPLIHFKPVLNTELEEAGRYKCPVYKTLERRGELSTTGHSTNYVLPILLAIGNYNVKHWIKRSVALVCQTSD